MIMREKGEMKLSLLLTVASPAFVLAAYPRDIVQYWVDQSAILVNGSIIGGLQSPPSAWVGAIVQGAVYLAAVKSQHQDLAFQQLAVSHAAHDTLDWTFHGTRLYASVDSALKAVLDPIGINATSSAGKYAAQLGREAAARVISKRSNDGINYFVDYVYGPKLPGVYQQTPGGAPLPDTPQAQFVRLFGGVTNVTHFRAVPPPSIKDSNYKSFLQYVKDQGQQNSTVRRPFDTDTAYFWRESAPVVWNRLAHAVIGRSLETNVRKSAKFYAQLNYALANAGIAAWDTKFFYNAWRPVTAIQRTDIWLPSGENVSSPNWIPLLTPTPSHPDYVSTHSTFGGAGSAVIRAYNGGDIINATISSNVTLNNRGVITRTFTNLTEAALQNAASRVFGGLHFQFAGETGIQLGKLVALETLEAFDELWAEF